jgi:hypothetical protein
MSTDSSGATGFWGAAQELLTTGVNAARDVQVARYQANDPTPRNRGVGNYTGRAGEPNYSPLADTLADTFSNPINIAMLGVAAVLLVLLIKRS